MIFDSLSSIDLIFSLALLEIHSCIILARSQLYIGYELDLIVTLAISQLQFSHISAIYKLFHEIFLIIHYLSNAMYYFFFISSLSLSHHYLGLNLNVCCNNLMYILSLSHLYHIYVCIIALSQLYFSDILAFPYVYIMYTLATY